MSDKVEALAECRPPAPRRPGEPVIELLECLYLVADTERFVSS